MFVGRDVYFLYSQVAQFGGVQFSTSTKSFSQYLQRNDICIMLKLPPNISVEICVFKVLGQKCMYMPCLDVLFYPNYWMLQTLPALCETQDKNRIFKCFKFNTSGSVFQSLWTSESKGIPHTSEGVALLNRSCYLQKIITSMSFSVNTKTMSSSEKNCSHLRNSSWLLPS